MAQEKPLPTLWRNLSPTSQKRWWATHRKGQPFPKEGEGDKGPSAAAAKKVKVQPRKVIAVQPGSVRALNAARQQAYMAKGGRQPIGAMGSGGSNVMAGGGQSTIKDLKASIKAGFNPKVSLDPYESEKAKKTGPRSLKIKNESIDEALSPERKRMFDLKLKLIKKVANKKSLTKPSKVDEPRTSLRPSKDMVLTPKSMPTVAVGHYKEEVQIDEVTKKEAEAMLGGPVKEKPKMPPGKQPAGYRYVRGLARKAMKKGMKEEVELTEAPKDAADAGEYDYEGDMAKSQLRSILANAKRMHDMLEDNTNLPEWVQSKITLAEDYVVTAANYMDGEMNEEVEQVDEKINLVKAKMGDVIKDFQKSDAPQFKGKSQEKRRQMAVAAKLGAERGAGMREEIEQVDEVTGYEGVKDRKDIIKRAAAMNRMGKDVFLSRVKARAAEMKKEKAKQKLAQEEIESVEEKYMGFAAVKKAVAAKGARDPAAVAAAIGRKKYGKEKFQAMAAAGKKANEEVVTEAEGKVAVTPKEKDLAAHHGDKKRITYGDVIKARLKSAAAKKMGK